MQRMIALGTWMFSICLLPVVMGQEATIPLNYPGPVYCLLKNGNVLHGKVDQSGDRVTVELDSSAKATIRASDLEFVGLRLRQLYDFQKNKRLRWDVGEHLHMANWCIRNDLLLEAEEHFNYLRQEIGNQPQFKQLEQQYRQALLNSPEVRKAAGLPVAKTKPTTSQETPSSQSVVRAAASEQAIDSMNLSAAAVGEFRTGLLPVLQSRCGQAACHGEYTQTSLKLFIVNRSNSSSDRALETALKYLNPEKPQQSKLIQMAITPHGLQTVRGFDPTNQNDRLFLERLQAWIGATKYPGAPTFGGPNMMSQMPSQASAGFMPWQDKVAAIKTQQEMQGKDAPITEGLQAGSPSLSGDELSRLEAEIARLEAEEAKQPAAAKDPFDPAQFNNQIRSATNPRKQ